MCQERKRKSGADCTKALFFLEKAKAKVAIYLDIGFELVARTRQDSFLKNLLCCLTSG
jgi:hypothetical protein